MAKLVLVSSSRRIVKKPEGAVPAVERFDGLQMRMIRKYQPYLANVDILILSPVYGLVRAEDRIGVKEPIQGEWNAFTLEGSELARLKKKSMRSLRSIFSSRHYDEVYVNVGKNLLRIITGFEGVVPSATEITFARGRGIGPKMAHMRDWLQSNSIMQ